MTDLSSATLGLRLERLGTLMRPAEGEPLEVEGVLNPATAWFGDTLYLYPRLVAEGNVSRVGRATVTVVDGQPVGVTRHEPVLEPDRSWERGTGHGGVEDPRITQIPALNTTVMTYVAFGPLGPRPALAVSTDGTTWQRLGPLQFAYDDALDADLNLFPNKDVVFFPEPVPDPTGRLSIAMLHRPMWEYSFSRPQEEAVLPATVTDDRPGIWISYVPLEDALEDLSVLTRPAGHRVVAYSQFEWESLKIGGGPAPVRVDDGWLLLHHGVSGQMSGGAFELQTNVRYSAGAMLLSAEDPSVVIARTAAPLLEPEGAEEREGQVGNVVFPTAIETIGERTFVFYGMADSRIGVAELHFDA